LHDAILCGVDLRRVDLRGVDFTGTDLSHSDLRGAALEEAILRNANLVDAHIEEACLVHADLRWARLLSAHLEEANLKNTNLEHANMQQAYLQFTNFEDANLKYACLMSARLADANFAGADLRFANLQDTDWQKARWDYTTIGIQPAPGGDLWGWKLIGGHMVKLLIPAGVPRMCGTTRLMRAKEAIITEIDDGEITSFDCKGLNGVENYAIWQTLEAATWSEDRWQELAGITFYLSRGEAEYHKEPWW